MISLLAQASVAKITNTIEKAISKVLRILKTTSGMQLSVINYVTTSVLIQNMETPLIVEGQVESSRVIDLIAIL